MKEIPISRHNGVFAAVDDEDFEALRQYTWCLSSSYAYRKLRKGEPGRRSKRDGISMHRQIMGLPPFAKREVDHINGDTLDNRRANLRFVTRSENMANTAPRSTNRSGVKGVSFDPTRGKWRMSIVKDGKQHSERFDLFDDAVLAYRDKAKELFGDAARYW